MESLECTLSLGMVGAGLYMFYCKLLHSLPKHTGREIRTTVCLYCFREAEQGEEI